MISANAHRGTRDVLDAFGNPVVDEDYPGETRPYLRFYNVGGVEGQFWGQVSGDRIVDNVALLARKAGARDVHSDQRESLMLASAFKRHRLRFHEHAYTSASKPLAVERVRRWLAEGMIVLPEHEKLRAELLSFEERITAAGTFTFGARGSGHDDFVALLLTAALADADGQLDGSPSQRGSRREIKHMEARASAA